MTSIPTLATLLRRGDYPDLDSLNADRRTREPISLPKRLRIQTPDAGSLLVVEP